MPSKPLRPCNKSGCPGLTNDGTGYCKDHQDIYQEKQADRHKYYNKARGKSSEQGYGWDWQKVRRMKIRQDPLCEDCKDKGKLVPAEEVHHIKPVKEYPELRLHMNNLRSLCRECHSATK